MKSNSQTAYASVRITGPFLDPLDVTLALRLPYDHAHRAGEPRIRRNASSGQVREYAPYRAGMWSMSSKGWVDSAGLDAHVRWLLDQLEERKDALGRVLVGDVRADIFCYSVSAEPGPPDLPDSTLARAEALRVEVEIDHYSLGDDDDD